MSKGEMILCTSKQKELDMLKNQLDMYIKIGEGMLSKGTKIQPKEFNVDVNDDVFKMQQSTI